MFCLPAWNERIWIKRLYLNVYAWTQITNLDPIKSKVKLDAFDASSVARDFKTD